MEDQLGKDLVGIEGLTAFNQDTLEEKLSKKLDDFVEKRKREEDHKRLTNELEALSKKLKEAEAIQATNENNLKTAVSQGITSDRRLHSLVAQQEKSDDQVKELTKTKIEVEAALKKLDEEDDKKDDEHEETVQEKSIRLGQMTAFGKVLQSSEKFEKEDVSILATLENDRNDNENNDVKRFKPQNAIKKGKGKRKDKVVRYEDKGYNTSDSDWDYSDSDSEEKKKTIRKSKTSSAVDDGDKDLFLERLQEWQDTRKELDSVDSKYEELEGGLRVPARLWQSLFHYQKVAVQWLWELHQQDVGGILGDEMGLGKTVQVVSFLASLAYSGRKQKNCRLGPVLIICPTTVMHQWVKEIHTWWPQFRACILHDTGSYQGPREHLIKIVGQSSSPSILVTSYSSVLLLKDQLTAQNFDYVILDEGHKIRNPDAQITLAVKQFATAHRLILSGSPLQNNLKELWSLFDFIYPGKLGTLPVFMQQFSIPITMGGYSNANRSQVATAHKCATVLRDTINPYLLRRLKSDVKSHINLPEKNEQVLFCRLTEEQRTLYRTYIESGEVKNILDGRLQVFIGLLTLRKLCNHPDLYDGGPKHFGTNEQPQEPKEEYGYWKRSGKMIVVESLLKLWKKQGHKVLLFTQSRKMLKILEYFLQDYRYTYLKLDGNTPIGSRQGLINKFNSSDDLFVFILTTKVGGLGVNLTGANRVVIFDPDWNPSTDTQARERAWRIGQSRDVTIYRLLTSGTIEEKIYHRQIFKQLLVNRVLKDPTQKRFFKSNDLYDLFSLNEGTSDMTETSAIFAGTNSEVDVKKYRRKRNREEEVKVCAVKPVAKKVKKIDTMKVISEDYRKPSLQRQQEEKCKAKSGSEEEAGKNGKSTLSQDERDRIREKVKRISMKLVGKEVETNDVENSRRKEEDGDDLCHRRKKHKKHKKHRRSKDVEFEGKRVSHLTKTDVYKPQVDPEVEKAKDDDYVLSKLFKKSGVHSALKHDVIMNGDGGADFALIDAEAERVAKEAVQRMRDSRRMCYRASDGIPTWTGANGLQKKPRFGKPLRKQPSSTSSSSSSSGGTLSAHDLLHRMKERNRLLPNQSRAFSFQGQDLFQPDNGQAFGANAELLADIRNFIAFQTSSAGEGEATTAALVDHFKEKLPPVKNPLFKALINEICDYRKATNGGSSGIWRLKEEFR